MEKKLNAMKAQRDQPKKLKTERDPEQPSNFKDAILSPLSPLHVVRSPLEPPINLPKQSSLQTITGIWNSMMGAIMLAIPWGFEMAGGIYLSSFIMIGILCLSMLTNDFIMRQCFYLKKEMLCEAMRVILGDAGYNITQCLCMVGMFGSLMALFIYMSNCFLGIYGAILIWNGQEPIQMVGTPLEYLLIAGSIIFVILWLLTMPKEKEFYLKLISGGVLFSIFLMGLVCFMSANAMSDKEEKISKQNESKAEAIIQTSAGGGGRYAEGVDPTDPTWLNLCALSAGAFGIQPFVVQLVANNRKPENNTRDMVLGNTFVGICYLLAGVMGYLGFSSSNQGEYIIAENVTAMFPVASIESFLVRILLLAQICCVFPLQLFILKIWTFHLFGVEDETNLKLGLNRFFCIGFPFFISIVYPSVGRIMAFKGAIASLWLTYISPYLLQTMLTKPHNKFLYQVEQKESDNIEEPLLEQEQRRGPSHHLKNQSQIYGSNGEWLAWSILYGIIPTIGITVFLYQIIGPFIW